MERESSRFKTLRKKTTSSAVTPTLRSRARTSRCGRGLCGAQPLRVVRCCRVFGWTLLACRAASIETRWVQCLVRQASEASRKAAFRHESLLARAGSRCCFQAESSLPRLPGATLAHRTAPLLRAAEALRKLWPSSRARGFRQRKKAFCSFRSRESEAFNAVALIDKQRSSSRVALDRLSLPLLSPEQAGWHRQVFRRFTSA